MVATNYYFRTALNSDFKELKVGKTLLISYHRDMGSNLLREIRQGVFQELKELKVL